MVCLSFVFSNGSIIFLIHIFNFNFLHLPTKFKKRMNNISKRKVIIIIKKNILNELKSNFYALTRINLMSVWDWKSFHFFSYFGNFWILAVFVPVFLCCYEESKLLLVSSFSFLFLISTIKNFQMVRNMINFSKL